LKGGTLDVTAHESLAGGTIREIYKVTGGANGAIYVDRNFVSLLENLYGQPALNNFRLRYPKDWLELMNNFEEKKKGQRATEGKVTRIRIPPKFREIVPGTSTTAGRPRDVEITNEYMCLRPEAMKQLFQPVVSGIVTHMEKVLSHPELNSVSCLFMVGGFAKSAILQEAIAAVFGSRCKILIPVTDPAIAIVQGATMFGQKPATISSRVMATTYGFKCWHKFDPKIHDPLKKVEVEGIEMCIIFDVIVKENEAVEVGETKRVIRCPLRSNQKSAAFTFYTSTNPDVKYIKDPTVGPSIGKVTVDSPDTSKGKDRDIELAMFFGGTEIKASAIDKTSGNVAAVELDFLSKS